MTIDQFLFQLGDKVDETGQEFYVWGAIRAKGTNFCPIDFMIDKCGAMTIGAEKLGMDQTDIHRIINAADTYDVEPILRSKLLEAVGLKP